MRKRTKWMIAGAAVLMIAALAVPILAQPGKGYGRGGDGNHGERMLAHMADQLELTEEQRAQLGEIFEARREGPVAEQRDVLRQARQQLRAVVHDPSADEQQVIDAVAVVSVEMEKMALQGHQLAIEVSQVLTDDQLQKLDELRQERSEGFGRFRHGRGRPDDGF